MDKLPEIKPLTQKEKLEARLKNMEKMKENHEQDLKEFDFVIEGLKKQISEL